MIPQKGKTYKIEFIDDKYPSFTHYNGFSTYDGKISVEPIDQNGKTIDTLLYGFELAEHPEMGTCYFEEKYIVSEKEFSGEA